MLHDPHQPPRVTVLAGSASRDLGVAVADRLGLPLTGARTDHFPDGEVDVAVEEDVLDADVYVIASLAPPVNDRLVELLLLLDASRRAGATRSTAVVPYLAYARKDRRSARGEAVSLRVVADAIAAAGADRAILVDPHVTQVDSIFSIPLEVVSAVPALAAAIAPSLPADTIVVAPDLGAVHLAEHYAAALGLESVAVVRKTRRSGSEVEAAGLVGSTHERPVLIVDDIVSTGATLAAAAELVMASWSTPVLSVAVTHGLLVSEAVARLAQLPIRTMVTSDSVAPAAVPPACSIVSLDQVLAAAIVRLHGPVPRGGVVDRA